jgi:segregation and condensation protein B
MSEPVPDEIEQASEAVSQGIDDAPAPVDDVVAEERSDLPEVESPAEARAIVEALLFTSNQSLSTRRLAGFLPGWTERQVLDLLVDLKALYEESRGGLMIQELAGGWTMATRPQWADWVYSLHRLKRRNPLTPQALETLSIIAYKQPITRADVEVIRGVDAGGMLRNLLDLGLIRITGHRETIGRPPLYGTTDLFLRTFGLKSLSDLPSVDELRALLPKESDPLAGGEETEEADEE